MAKVAEHARRAMPGADIIIDQIANKPSRKRVGIKPDGRAPARAGTEITEDLHPFLELGLSWQLLSLDSG